MIFGASSLMKALRFREFRDSLVPRTRSLSSARALAAATVVFELCLAISFLTNAHQAGALAAMFFLVASSAWLVSGNLTTGSLAFSSCKCFGGLTTDRLGEAWPAVRPLWWSLRNGVLTGAALAIAAPWPLPVALAVGYLAVSAAMSIRLAAAVMVLRRRLKPVHS